MLRELLTTLRFSPALLLAACVAVPEPPDAPSPGVTAAAFSNDTLAGIGPEAVRADWWARFDDPVLTQLIEQALVANRELAVAAANIETASALLAAQRLDFSTSTASSAGADLGRAPREGADTEVSGSAQLGASWEFDAFGRIDALTRGAQFNLQSEIEARRDVAVTVAAETALAYADLRGSQVRLDVARSNAELQGDSLELLNTLFENGRATQLDLERAQAQLRTTLASLPQLEADMRIAAVRLVTLTGQAGPDEAPMIASTLVTSGEIPSPPDTLSAGTPEDLIRRRPDIRAAEADIAELLALGEAERARLFPTLTFNANILSLFNEDNDLGDSFGIGLGPSIRWDGPDLRRVRADIDISDARTRQAMTTYELRVIEAIGEVETALIGYSLERGRRADLEAAAASAERAASLARLRFEEGLDDFLDVIDAQRAQLDAQDRLELSRLETTRQAIAAYRALGGIWPAESFENGANSGVDGNE